MTDEMPRPSRAAWPFGLIGMLVLVVATERYIAKRDTDLGTMYSIEWRMTGESAKRHAAKTSICCFGTSLMHMGVSPRLLEERLGRPAYNFALSGGQPFATYTMFRHILNAGGKPEALVVEYKWSALAVDHTWNERVLPEMATLSECAEFALTARDPIFLARLAIVSQLPSYRCRIEVRENILAAIKGKEPKRNYERAIMTYNARVNRGANHAPKNKDFKGVIYPDDTHLFPKNWKCDPVSEIYMHRFFDLAAERKIPVFWLIPPVAPPTQARRDEIGAEERYTEFVKNMTAKHPEVTVVDARFSKYALEAFFDTTHLNRNGAVTLSTDLANSMATKLSLPHPPAGQWVCLPDYHPSSDFSKAEDFSDSLASIVEENKKKARR